MSPSGKSSWFLGVSEGVHPGGGWSVEQTPPPPRHVASVLPGGRLLLLPGTTAGPPLSCRVVNRT